MHVQRKEGKRKKKDYPIIYFSNHVDKKKIIEITMIVIFDKSLIH